MRGPRLLILGAGGQLGRVLQQVAIGFTIDARDSSQVDVTNPELVRRAILTAQPDVVVNCSAFTAVDDAEVARDRAHRVNAMAPGSIAQATRDAGARCIHVSTDFVFDGAQGAPYDIDAPTHPLNWYGESKRDGELAALDADPAAAVIRTAWVHSPFGRNFIVGAVRALSAGTPMRVVDDHVGTPTRAAHLASAILRLASDRAPRGILHFTDAGVASRYDVASAVRRALTASGAGQVGRVDPVSAREFPAPAVRPPFAVLDKHSTWTALGITPQHWIDGVELTVRELLART